jgi:hypothetical protein
MGAPPVETTQGLAHAPQLGELREHELDRLPHPRVRVLLDAPVAGLHVADGQAEDQDLSLGKQPLLGPLPGPPRARPRAASP